MDTKLIPETSSATNDNDHQHPEVIITSTNKYLSLELSQLMPIINENPAFMQEDQSYFENAINHVKNAKELQKKDDYAGAMKAISKAVKLIGELVTLRQPCNSSYQVLEAPFLYQQGSILTAYIEAKSDVFGNVPVLDLEESEDEEEEEPADGEEIEAADA